MAFQGIHKPCTSNPIRQKSSSPFAPRPFAVQAQQRSDRSLTREEIENEAFQQHNHEVTDLEMKAQSDTSPPEERERPGVLRAEKNDSWAQRSEIAPRFSHNFGNIPVYSPKENRPDGIAQRISQEIMNSSSPARQTAAGFSMEHVHDRVPQRLTLVDQLGQMMQRNPLKTYTIQRFPEPAVGARPASLPRVQPLGVHGPVIQRTLEMRVARGMSKSDFDTKLMNPHKNDFVAMRRFEHGETLTNEEGPKSDTKGFSKVEVLEPWRELTWNDTTIGRLHPLIPEGGGPEVAHKKMHFVSSRLHPKANEWVNNWVWGSLDLNGKHYNKAEKEAIEQHPQEPTNNNYALSYRTEVTGRDTTAITGDELAEQIQDEIRQMIGAREYTPADLETIKKKAKVDEKSLTDYAGRWTDTVREAVATGIKVEYRPYRLSPDTSTVLALGVTEREVPRTAVKAGCYVDVPEPAPEKFYPLSQTGLIQPVERPAGGPERARRQARRFKPY